MGPHLISDQLTFHGRTAPLSGPLGPFGSVQLKGHYRATLSSEGPPALETLVDTTETMPGGEETFSQDFANGLTSQYLAVDGGDVLFRGVGTTGAEKTRFGLYVRREADGSIEQILDTDDTLDGSVIFDLLIGRHGFDGGEVVVYVESEEGEQSLWLAKPLGQ